jgi:pseudouridine synthase
VHRLDKILVDTGCYTRSEAKRLIAQGRVTVDGSVVKQAAEKFDHSAVEIAVSGQMLASETFVYLMMNKPAGVLSATRDGRGETVLDLLPARYAKMGLFPVGRLDKDSVGLLLLTNDGALAHDLLHPKRHVEKRYYVEVDGALDSADAAAFAVGMTMRSGEVFLPAGLELCDKPNAAVVTLREGKYHQIKRMLGSLGKPVIYLKRLSMGALVLDERLEAGEFRTLTEAERENILLHKKR